ncbi:MULTISPECIES: YheC/YheD family protein [unclassified Paenibacillus]|uniref:YheC/YheD family protein n=1 Tax=unclassified Paenibacillus TaxID=185978 RepID=UPI000FE279C7|nr:MULTISPECIES: YheC/YheD family protein [unclassified Paenibacillus]MCM3175041.1 YheC/YheD family protein [Paenibacillus sp. MER 99-2]
MSRQLASKWRKTAALLKYPVAAVHIPQTMAFNARNLQLMLGRYGMVYIKPIVGGGGYGVIKVSTSGGSYRYTHMKVTRTFTNYSQMYRSLMRVKAKRRYLIQQGIHLATIQGRPVDYRVKVVKTERGWVFRALVGRLARPGLCITNLSKGGTMLSGRRALQLSLPHISSRHKRREMRALTLTCTRIMEVQFPGVGQLGFDYGIDYSGKIWILEVNTRPQ